MQSRRVFFNGENMGEFKTIVSENGIYIIGEKKTEKRYMQIKLKGSGKSIFVDQDSETVIGLSSKISKESIGEYVDFDLTEEEVGVRVSIIMAKGG